MSKGDIAWWVARAYFWEREQENYEMSTVTSKVLALVNAPYSAGVSAWELAKCISSLDAMNKAYGPTFSFFTEVEAEVQHAFVGEMHLDANAVKAVAQHLATQVPFPIALAA